ncbi:hypothetical protein MBLNU457_5364t1 [Dothideomycetes sp. NU457]
MGKKKESAPEEQVRRLGRRHLGRHAYETQMPPRISSLITQKDQTPHNRLENILPILRTLLTHSPKTSTAYLCTSTVAQLHSLDGEGQHFCGYRNMQMLLSSLPTTSTTTESLNPDLVTRARKATVLELQSLIETAWTAGHNAHGRIETGGILNTRKHVGTSEAETLFALLGIRTTARVFTGKRCWIELHDYVQAYFSAETMADGAKSGAVEGKGKVRMTGKSPIFLQRPRHSLTIVGLEVSPSGRRRLIVFDPGYSPPASMVSATERADRKVKEGKEERVLAFYRRGERYLKRFEGFETLHLKL